MADVATDKLKPEASPTNKRKRAPGGETPGDRRAKRGAGMAVSTTSATAPSASLTSPESIPQALLMETAAQAAANAASVDLSALQQANEAASHAEATDAVAAASSTAAAALGSMYPTSVPIPNTTAPPEQYAEPSTHGQDSSQDASFAAEVSPPAQVETANTTTASLPSPASGSMMIPNWTSASQHASQYRKPAVGTEEWHKIRKDNHKEVERRRRETINEGINELAKIVPNCEKNKGAILQQAVQYIQQLKGEEASNIEKWTLEKLLTEQAIAELTATADRYKAEVEQLYKKDQANIKRLEEKEKRLEEMEKRLEEFEKQKAGH